MLRRLIVIFVLLSLITFGLWAYFRWQDQQNSKHIVLYGNVDVRQVNIGFRVQGLIQRMYYEEGDVVQKGTLVAELEEQPYRDSVKEAEANLETIKIQIANSEKLYNRREELVQSGGVSAEDLENTESTYQQQLSNLKAAEAALDIAKANYSFTEAFSPNDGIILTRVREPGTVVNPADTVYTISITDPVWIRAYVSEPQLGQVYYGMPAKTHTDTKNGKVYEGKVGFISPVAEFTPKTVETTQLRTNLVYRLRIYVQDPDSGLRQGQPVTVAIDLPQADKGNS